MVKSIKYLLGINLLLFLLPINLIGQDIAPDFTLTDLNGDTYNLYDELDLGKTVLVEFFATDCGYCHGYAPLVEELWQTNGADGETLWIWSIEAAGANDVLIQEFIDQHSSTNPFFSTKGNRAVVDAYGVTWTPRFFVVCPDRTMTSCLAYEAHAYIDTCAMTTDNQLLLAGQKRDVIEYNNQDITIDIDDFKNRNFTIDIYNSTSNKILTKEIKETISIPFNKSSYKSDIYFIRVSNGKESFIRKIVVL